MLDIDNKEDDEHISINEFKRKFSAYHYILYPSTNHLKEIDKYGCKREKFRVILPIDPNKYNHFDSIDMHQRAYNSLKEQFPFMDNACTSAHSKFFPYCGDKKDFFVYVHKGTDYFYPTLLPRKIDFTVFKKIPYFTLDTEVLDKHGKILKISQIDKKTEIFCPFCDHTTRGNPDSANASIEIGPLDVPQLYCSSCDSRGKGKSGTYHLNPDEAYNIQSIKNGSIIFRDILTDKYYFGNQSVRDKSYQFNKIAKLNIENALKNLNMHIPKSFPEVEFTYDFTKRDQFIDIENGFVNRYISPTLLKTPANPSINQVPPYIQKIMMHFLGDDKSIYHSLINHLAYMVQTGEKLRVSFLFQGVQGTGKGLWFNHVIAPIFGRNYCTQIQQRSFLKVFNSWLENNYCLLVDEVEADFHNHGDEFARILKQIIADRCIAIESKGMDIKNGEINANLFFATNKRNGLLLEQSDRRFIIGAWQDKNIFDMDWWLGDNQMAKKLKTECQDFVSFLKNYKIDNSIINRVVKNDARNTLIEFSKTNTEVFFDKLKALQWDWFEENLNKPTEEYNDIFLYKKSQDILKNIKGKTKISRSDLRILFTNIFKKEKTPAQFTKLCKLHGVNVKQMKINGKNTRGVALR